jgi:molybdopterin synthase catalytic subunit
MAKKPPDIVRIEITRKPIDLADAVRDLGIPGAGARRRTATPHPQTGAVVAFTGLIRATEQDRPIRGIDYEQYEGMALREMERIAEEARKQWPIQAAVLFHRVGLVKVGEPSVAVAVAAGHRAEAFAAARFLIDTLKERVPLWKNFVYADADGDANRGSGRLPPFVLAVPLQTEPASPETFARRAVRGGANAIELRADALVGREGFPVERILDLAKKLKKAAPSVRLILTPRAYAEGGMARLSLARRRELIEALIPAVDAVDVELRSRTLARWAVQRVRQAGKALILSVHDFIRTPATAKLNTFLKEAEAYPDALLKIAVATPRKGDVVRLAAWTHLVAPRRPLAVMNMGDTAAAGRLLLAALGSRLAFAALDRASAPGQIDVRTFSRALANLRPKIKSTRRPAAKSQLDALLLKAEASLRKS